MNATVRHDLDRWIDSWRSQNRVLIEGSAPMGGALSLWSAFRNRIERYSEFDDDVSSRLATWSHKWMAQNLVAGSAPFGGALFLWEQIESLLLPYLIKSRPKIAKQKSFPGGSKGRVSRAGDRVRLGTATDEDLLVIEDWRAAHRAVLNTFQATLRGRTRYSDVIVAQRHKRRRTIFDKLLRFPDMKLVRMDDVAGCRLIFESIDALYKFRNDFHKAKFKHKLRNDIDRYDYIQRPKESGYRGVHDVYEYDVRSDTNRNLTGLYVEIQYRTLVQHAWATAVEVIGFITESQPKFDRGDDRYLQAMVFASEIMARSMEQTTGPMPHMSDVDVVTRFLELDEELHLLQTLKGLNAADKAYSEKKNAILVFSDESELEIYEYRDAPDALRALFELERMYPDKDVVLVRADTSEDVRLAFKNYFSDARDFVRYVEHGCAKLRRRTPR